MMDEHLRDNVARLLAPAGEEPSSEFAARLEKRIESRSRGDRMNLFTFALAASLILAAVGWTVSLPGNAPAVHPDKPGPIAQDPEFDDPVLAENAWKYQGLFLAGAELREAANTDLVVGFPAKGEFKANARVPFSAANRKVLQAMQDRASGRAMRLEMDRVREFFDTRALDRQVPAKPYPQWMMARENLPFLQAFAGDDRQPDNRRGPASDTIAEILWGDCRALERDILSFLQTNGYWMVRGIMDYSNGGRVVIDLAQKSLQGPWRSAINLAMEHLGDESIVPESKERRVCQNAITFLMEMTDRFEWQLHEPEVAEQTRAGWKTWWKANRTKDPGTWCFGLTPAEKAKLRDIWLPAPPAMLRGGWNERIEPTEDDLLYVTGLGGRGVPYLLHVLRADPPRNTLWETDHVEWNYTVDKLLTGMSGKDFGGFDPEDRAGTKHNAAVYAKWIGWGKARK